MDATEHAVWWAVFALGCVALLPVLCTLLTGLGLMGDLPWIRRGAYWGKG